MASKLEEKHVSDGGSTPDSNDLAVRPVDIQGVIPSDGPVVQPNSSSANTVCSTPNRNASSASERAVCETHSVALTVEDAKEDDAVDKNPMPSSVEPGATCDTIVGQDNHESKKVDESACAAPAVVGAKNDDVIVADGASGSMVPGSTDIRDATSGLLGPEATHDTTVQLRDADTETVSKPVSGAPTMVVTKNTGEVDQDVASDPVEPEAIEAREAPKPTFSVPPHLRPNNQSSANPQHRYTDMARAPRNHYANNSFRGFDGREEIARSNAQIMKLRNELEAERKKSLSMRASMEQELQKSTDAIVAGMTTELFQKQVKTLAQQGKLEAKERELMFREAQIGQMEMFLSVGQKQVYRRANGYEDSGEATLSMEEVNREHESRQAELIAQKNMSDREGTLSMREKAVQLREAAQMMREQQYKTLVRGAVEAEHREDAMPNMDARLKEVADVEYNRGFGAGKIAGRAAADREAHEQSFLEGYAAARGAEVALNKLKMGNMARDSPELDFLYNPSHPFNLFAMGERIKSMDLSKEKACTANGAPVQAENRSAQEQRRSEEAVRRLPPARATFAAELRGASNMHKGQPVLANGPASIPPRDSVYEGRKVVKYEEDQGENLIDLY